MRLLALLLAATAALPACAAAQNAPAAPAAVRSDRAARLEALGEAAERGELAALRRALGTERDRDVRTLIDARLRALRLDAGVSADPRLRALAAERSPRDLRRAALDILGSASFGSGDYAEAVRLSGALERLLTQAGDAEAAKLTAMTRRIAELLAAEPRQMLEGPLRGGRSAARRDIAGLMRVDMKVNGSAQDAVFDTGANLSVLSATTAQRLGVRMLEGAASVGNSVRTTVPVRLGMADRLEIGGNVLRNVAFLVIDDAALSFGPGGVYKIPAILGYPVMQALQRFRVEAEAFVVEPGGAGGSEPPNLAIAGNEMFVDATVGGVEVPLYLDTGANPSHLDPLFVEAHPKPFAGLVAEERQRAGAGGQTTDRAVRWRDVAVEIAGRAVQVPSLAVGVPGGEAKPSKRYGVIGADLLGRFASYTIDLRRMRLELGEPVPAAAAAR